MTRQAAYRKRQSEAGWRRVDLRLSPDESERLDKIAAQRGKSVNETLRDALANFGA